jgi:eukaryotic-like serine/threonine-protein kinase
MNTTVIQQSRTLTFHGATPEPPRNAGLCKRYDELVQSERLGWTEHLKLKRLLGTGGQGVVYLSERRGADGFTLPVALKFLSPERYTDERTYNEAMLRMAEVGGRVAQIQTASASWRWNGSMVTTSISSSPPACCSGPAIGSATAAGSTSTT